MKTEIKPQIAELMKDAVALYVNKPNALLFGRKTYIAENKEIVPYKKENDIMVPVDFFAKTVGFDGIEMMSNLSEDAGNGILYAPIAELCRICGWYLHVEKNGIVIYSRRDMEDVLDWRTNINVMRRISESYVFDDAEEIRFTRQ